MQLIKAEKYSWSRLCGSSRCVGLTDHNPTSAYRRIQLRYLHTLHSPLLTIWMMNAKIEANDDIDDKKGVDICDDIYLSSSHPTHFTWWWRGGDLFGWWEDGFTQMTVWSPICLEPTSIGRWGGLVEGCYSQRWWFLFCTTGQGAVINHSSPNIHYWSGPLSSHHSSSPSSILMISHFRLSSTRRIQQLGSNFLLS